MIFLLSCWCYGTILLTISTGILSYNFDLDNAIVYDNVVEPGGSREGYAGFSVALWNSGNAGLEKSWLYIGSPKANSSSYKNVAEPGTVWKCKIGKACEEWVVADEPRYEPVEGSWLGGVIEIENTTDANIVVCGPRWLDKLDREGYAYNLWHMTGLCYHTRAANLAALKGAKSIPVQPPFLEKLAGLSKWNLIGAAVAGFSVQFNHDNSHSIIMGSPGAWVGQGIAIQYSLDSRNFIFPSVDYYGTKEKDYDYSGYAVTSGFYFGPGNLINALSAPRSTNLRGRVTLFKFPVTFSNQMKTIFQSTYGQQAGEYFGAALASCDVNGDNFDDLIVGAPQWTKIIDEGRVYIYNGNANKNLKNPITFDGKEPRGRYGTAITCLGDVDYDGYADLAVGAPYAGNGVVYIYHGGRDGLTRTQTIYGAEDNRGFGISISQPRDIDNNKYSDIAVGAYLSGHVTLFRSRRAVTTRVTLSPEMSGKFVPENATSLSLQVCSSYDGKHAPPTLNVVKKLKIDEILQRARIYIYGHYLKTYEFIETLTLGRPSCKSLNIIIEMGDHNFFEPLKFSVTQGLNMTYGHGMMRVTRDGPSGKEHFDSFSAVMNERHSIIERIISVPFAVDCGNNICISQLKINMVNDLKSRNSYVIDSSLFIRINISISNTRDTAYLPKVIFNVSSVIRVNQLSHQYRCDDSVINEIRQITCNVGKTLKQNQEKVLSLDLDVSAIKSNTKEIKLNAIATTLSQDNASGDHKDEMVINCVTRTDIGIMPKVTLDRYTYSLETEEEQLPSIRFQQIYDIKNYEATLVSEASFSISIPTHWMAAGNEIEIIQHNKTQGFLEGQEILCMDVKSDTDHKSVSYDATTNPTWLYENNSSMKMESQNRTFEIVNGKVFVASPDNRTLHLNCTNPSIKCKSVNCKLNTFKNTQSLARLSFVFDLLLANITPEVIQNKDIIFFATNASVRIEGLPAETINKEPNLFMIGTKFIALPKSQGLSGWVIPVSILVGLLLLILIILALFKFGFFKRNKQLQLRALLKEKNDAPTGTAMEETDSVHD